MSSASMNVQCFNSVSIDVQCFHRCPALQWSSSVSIDVQCFNRVWLDVQGFNGCSFDAYDFNRTWPLSKQNVADFWVDVVGYIRYIIVAMAILGGGKYGCPAFQWMSSVSIAFNGCPVFQSMSSVSMDVQCFNRCPVFQSCFNGCPAFQLMGSRCLWFP